MRGRGRAPGNQLTAALRVADQAAERSPVVCVKTGVPTDRATRVRATALAHPARWEESVGTTAAVLVARLLRRPTTSVVLAVDDAAWRTWRRRLGRAVALASGGVGAIGVGLARGDLAVVGFGLLLVALSAFLRARSWRACWVGLQLRPDTGDIVVTRVHPAFADQARRLWVASLGQR